MSDTHSYSLAEGRPWFGMGKEVEGAKSVKQALTTAGLDWTVEKASLFSKHGSKYVKAPDRWAVQRSSDGRVLGTVGKDYVTFQNDEAFTFLDASIKTGETVPDAAGDLFNGKRVWMSVRLSPFAVFGDDQFEQYLFLTNSHDGSRALQGQVVPMRANGFSVMPVANRFPIRHRGDAAAKATEAKETLQNAFQFTHEFMDKMEALGKKDVSPDMFEEIMRRTFPDQKRQLAANMQHVKLIRSESPRIPDDLRGTAYGALSAMSEWVSWGKDYRTAEARMKSLLFGWSRDVVTTVADVLLLV